MPKTIELFVEDFAHQEVIGAIVSRVCEERGQDCSIVFRSASRGHGRVVSELEQFARDLTKQGAGADCLIVVATDANCRGYNERRLEIEKVQLPTKAVLAVPDPHIERWLLLDGAAFKKVLGRGCQAPDHKCDRDRYKQVLMQEISAAEIMPALGGIEYARDLINSMDFDRAARADRSFARFVSELRGAL